MKIRWTPAARSTYFRILNYFSEEWSEKEYEMFIERTNQTITKIAENPYMFKATNLKRNIRRGFITEHSSLYYRVKPRKREIELLTFWDNRQNPAKMKL